MQAKNVLLVDDEVAIRNLFLLSLEKEGFTVFAAAGVGEAKRLAHDLEFDLAVIDLHLPDGDGFELARSLRQMSPNTRTVAMAAAELDEELRVALQESGVCAFHHKISPMKDLINLLHSHSPSC